ncbi:TrbC/VirB2 family protein [uncultured Erythrobacter sp.]|uniref:TrbC/VirB2 family protein n=1 Tax=uncultured Erythrobacter sp. TaxID=263913 RepID=UPI0026266E10|nr:TrbC/VirB2 family protein [uncultured Erythrobacter sp.]
MTSIASSVDWFVGVVTGPLVTGFLTLAVAFVGFRLLSGRSSIREGAYVVIGGFVLIGSTYVAQSLVDLVPRSAPPVHVSAEQVRAERELTEPPSPPPNPRGNPFDPYAGNEQVN